MTKRPFSIVVIGAGICGLSAAIWLRRAGHDVTLIDREHPGAGASCGNAGLLAQWAVVPVNTPDLWRAAPRYLLDPAAPFWVQWRALPGLLPWLARFFANATPRGAEHMIANIAQLVTDSVAQHRALTRRTRAGKWIADSDLAHAYPSRAGFEADGESWAWKRRFGFEPELIEGPAVREHDPALGPGVGCLAVIRAQGHVLDPAAYMADLARVLEDEGGRVMRAEARDFRLEGGRISAVETDRGALPCDRAVLAAGIWSKALMRRLGLKVPLAAERGFHLHFRAPSVMPRAPMMISAGKFVVTPMAGGLRCAGMVQLGDATGEAPRAPFRLIRRHLREVLPGLEHEGVEEWMGFRPTTPDSLPLIGEIGCTGVHAAFGHQHVGLTAGPKTGRIVAALIDGQPPDLDLSACDANRFR